MAATRRIEHAAPKKHLLTLDQLAAFVQDAMRSGATGNEHIDARVSFGGKLQKVSIEIEVAAPTTDLGKDTSGRP